MSNKENNDNTERMDVKVDNSSDNNMEDDIFGILMEDVNDKPNSNMHMNDAINNNDMDTQPYSQSPTINTKKRKRNETENNILNPHKKRKIMDDRVYTPPIKPDKQELNDTEISSDNLDLKTKVLRSVPNQNNNSNNNNNAVDVLMDTEMDMNSNDNHNKQSSNATESRSQPRTVTDFSQFVSIKQLKKESQSQSDYKLSTNTIYERLSSVIKIDIESEGKKTKKEIKI